MVSVIKTVDGDGGTYRAVALTHVIAIVFGLTSVIGFLLTWSVAVGHERQAFMNDVDRLIDLKIATVSGSALARLDSIDNRLSVVESRQRINEDIINRNTGWIEAQKGKR